MMEVGGGLLDLARELAGVVIPLKGSGPVLLAPRLLSGGQPKPGEGLLEPNLVEVQGFAVGHPV